ncbi:MAG: hypothetical protein [Olavius algarvensis Gamma 1 endosymbiont]|nr:MAG: hypothetical protein [Olavius algarvensis Gamma 1 endosymbiont]
MKQDGISFDRNRLRGCLGTHFRNSLKIGRLDKINPLF